MVYVFLAAKEKASCWFWGIISCSLWAYADFARYNLWVDGILQLFYVVIGFYGLYSWKFGGSNKASLNITRLRHISHIWIILCGAIGTLLLGLIFDYYTPTALPYPDSLVTSFSIIATFLTIKKKLENWLYWIGADFLAIFLFAAREAWLVSFVMFIYTIIAIFGFYNWRRKFATRNEVSITA